jgi:hypothetical protein
MLRSPDLFRGVQELARQGMPMAIATLKRSPPTRKHHQPRRTFASNPGRLPAAATIERERSAAY